jgi:hypothetical protein
LVVIAVTLSVVLLVLSTVVALSLDCGGIIRGLDSVLFEGIEDVVEFVGIEDVVEFEGIEDVVEFVGIEDVVEFVGIEDVVEFVGIEDVVEFSSIVATGSVATFVSYVTPFK